MKRPPFRGLLYAVALPLAAYSLMGAFCLSQGGSNPTLDISRPYLSEKVVIVFNVVAQDRKILVPYQGKSCREGGRQIANGMEYLEKKTRKGWEKAEFRKRVGGIPEIYGPWLWFFEIVPPGEARHFFYEFDNINYFFSDGQRLRLVLQIWYDEETMRTGKGGIKIYSKPFIFFRTNAKPMRNLIE